MGHPDRQHHQRDQRDHHPSDIGHGHHDPGSIRDRRPSPSPSPSPSPRPRALPLPRDVSFGRQTARPRRSDESDLSILSYAATTRGRVTPSLSSSQSSEETSASDPAPLTPHMILRPDIGLADIPGSFAQAVSWKGTMPRLYPSGAGAGFLDSIKTQLLHPAPGWQRQPKPREEVINTLAVEWLGQKARASGPSAEVGVVGNQIANDWGPGLGMLPRSEANNPNTPDDTPCATWRDSPLQKHLIGLRLRAGLLKEVTRYKRKTPGGDATLEPQQQQQHVLRYDAPFDVGVDNDHERPISPSSSSSLSSIVLSAPTPCGSSTSTSLAADHVSLVTATDSAASSATFASRHAGLNKPDFVILGQVDPNLASSTLGNATATATTPTPTSASPPVRTLQPSVVSAVGERKDDPVHAAEGFAQVIGYGLTSWQVFGTNFGFYWFQARYLRFVIVEPDLIVIESSANARAEFAATPPAPPPLRPVRPTADGPPPSSSLQSLPIGGGTSPYPSTPDRPPAHDTVVSIRLGDLLSNMSNQTAIEMCVNHMWDEQGEEDVEGIQTLWNMWSHCVTLVLQQQTSCPRFRNPAIWEPIVRSIKAGAKRWEASDIGPNSWTDLAVAAYKGQARRLKEAATAAEPRDDTPGRGGTGGEDGEGGEGRELDDAPDGRGGGRGDDTEPRGEGEPDTGSREFSGYEYQAHAGQGSAAVDRMEMTIDTHPGGSHAGHADMPSIKTHDTDLRAAVDDAIARKRFGGREQHLTSLRAYTPSHQAALDATLAAFPRTEVLLVPSGVLDTIVGAANREMWQGIRMSA